MVSYISPKIVTQFYLTPIAIHHAELCCRIAVVRGIDRIGTNDMSCLTATMNITESADVGYYSNVIITLNYWKSGFNEIGWNYNILYIRCCSKVSIDTKVSTTIKSEHIFAVASFRKYYFGFKLFFNNCTLTFLCTKWSESVDIKKINSCRLKNCTIYSTCNYIPTYLFQKSILCFFTLTDSFFSDFIY